MPTVISKTGTMKKFPYTKEGQAAAKKYATKVNGKIVTRGDLGGSRGLSYGQGYVGGTNRLYTNTTQTGAGPDSASGGQSLHKGFKKGTKKKETLAEKAGGLMMKMDAKIKKGSKQVYKYYFGEGPKATSGTRGALVEAAKKRAKKKGKGMGSFSSPSKVHQATNPANGMESSSAGTGYKHGTKKKKKGYVFGTNQGSVNARNVEEEEYTGYKHGNKKKPGYNLGNTGTRATYDSVTGFKHGTKKKGYAVGTGPLANVQGAEAGRGYPGYKKGSKKKITPEMVEKAIRNKPKKAKVKTAGGPTKVKKKKGGKK